MGYAFRIVNVFTVNGDRLSGNPLCVFEDAGGLSDAQMQALARQMNPTDEGSSRPSYLPIVSAVVRRIGRGSSRPATAGNLD